MPSPNDRVGRESTQRDSAGGFAFYEPNRVFAFRGSARLFAFREGAEAPN